MNTTNAKMFQAHVPRNFWEMAFIDLINWSLSSANDDGTQFKRWREYEPKLSNIKPFGCLAYGLNENEMKSKLTARANPYILIGYTERGCIVYDIIKKEMKGVRHVELDGSTFYRDLVKDYKQPEKIVAENEVTVLTNK